MKKLYNYPELTVSCFTKENIVTSSLFSLKTTIDGDEAANYGNINADSIVGINE